MTKKYLPGPALSIAIAIILLTLIAHAPARDMINRRLCDQLIKVRYNLCKRPPAINDITLVLIDNDTLKKMPSRWPYPRSDFAKVIDNLKKAGAKTIAFDFVFLGSSSPQDDSLLKNALENNDNIVLACSVNERGALDFHSLPALGLAKEVPAGIITKIQDKDGVTRRALTYLVADSAPDKGYLSWEMQVLKMAESVSLDSFSSSKDRVVFKNSSAKLWSIPVTPGTKSFMINFTAHTPDFRLLSFYDVLKNNFDPSAVKNKIALIGLASSLFADLHNTPIGWLPGITLNANSFLTLYGRHFLNPVPGWVGYILIIIGVAIASLLVSALKAGAAYILISAEIALFFLLSYLLLMAGYIWNYSDFPIALIICPAAAKKILG